MKMGLAPSPRLSALMADIRGAETALAEAEGRAFGRPRPDPEVERAATRVIHARRAWLSAWRSMNEPATEVAA